MNFFHIQKQARSRALVLALGYVIVLVLSLFLFYALILWAMTVSRYLCNVIGEHYDSTGDFVRQPYPGWWNPAVFLISSGIVLLAMIGATCWRLFQLSRGGWVVAHMLGGTPVEPNASNLEERRLLNVVEEIAIAAGAQIPAVYILKGEIGLNAFAAGFGQDDAVIGVTRGCLNVMSRDELQATVAHEFSHIMSGDSALKTLLAGLLFGIKAPGYYFGTKLLQMVQGEGDYLLPALFWIVFVLFSVISIPFILTTQAVAMLAAALKRMLSVQIEYHADARAVQFCRNPTALAGSLKKIGGHASGSRMLVEASDQASHFFFANPYGHCFLGWSWLLAHPALIERIRRIEPDFNGDFQHVSSVSARDGSRQPYRTPAHNHGSGDTYERPDAFDDLLAGPALAVTAATLAAIPDALQGAVRDVGSARLLVVALLLSAEDAVRERQLAGLRRQTPEHTIYEMLTLYRMLGDRSLEQKLPLAKLAVRTLKAMAPADYPAFRRDVDDLIRADGRINPLEAALRHTIIEHLAPVFENKPHTRTVASMKEIENACRTLLSCLTYWGVSDVMEQDQAYQTGMSHIAEPAKPPPILARHDCDDHAFDNALSLLAQADQAARHKALEACRLCILANGRISTMERQLLLTIADAIDCPEHKMAA